MWHFARLLRSIKAAKLHSSLSFLLQKWKRKRQEKQELWKNPKRAPVSIREQLFITQHVQSEAETKSRGQLWTAVVFLKPPDEAA